jgi:electron transport complex protein RnfB
MEEKGGVVSDTYLGQTIPVHVELQSTQVILAQPEMRALLAQAEIIALGDCGCRKEAAVCDHPLDVCLAVDNEAREEIKKHGWREISIADAVSVLERSHRAGLVHIAYRKPGEPVTMVCSCCTCACSPLRQLKGRDYHELVTESAYVAALDASVCVGCQTCTQRCPFGAFSACSGSDAATFYAKNCFGCGLCVSTCPTGAISFVKRD